MQFLKRRAPDAQAQVDAIAAKLTEAQAAEANAQAEVERVAVAVELPPLEGGITKTPEDLKAARAMLAEARDTVEVKRLALNEAEKRLADAKANDASRALTATWNAQEKLGLQYTQALTRFIDLGRQMKEAGETALELREQLVAGCPALVARFGGLPQDRVREGHDRLVYLRDLSADFSPPHRPNSLGGTLEEVLAREASVVERLTVRFLGDTPPPPPPVQGPVQGPMLHTGHAA